MTENNLDKNHNEGTLILQAIKYDHLFKRVVMKSGSVGKVYLPKELIGKKVYVIVDMNNIQEQQGKEAVKLP